MNQALSVRGRGPGYSEALAPLLSYATKSSPVDRPKSSIGGSFLPYFIPCNINSDNTDECVFYMQVFSIRLENCLSAQYLESIELPF